MEDLKIFIITHKDYCFPESEGYYPLLVGANNNIINYKNKYFKDNENDNISNKNSSFCELTGLYWMWKNVETDIIGLVHYRRYFFKKRVTKNLKKIIDKERIINILKNKDIIVPEKKYTIDGSVYNDYKEHHFIKDLEKCKDIIKNKYPEYNTAFDTVMKRDFLYPYNMFIMKKELLDNYCEWLFTILFDLEKSTDLSDYDDYNKRIYGFLSERLFNVWIEYNGLKPKEIHVNNLEENIKVKRMENGIRFAIVKSPFKRIVASYVRKTRKKRKNK